MRRWDSSYNVGLAWLRPIMHSYGECLNGIEVVLERGCSWLCWEACDACHALSRLLCKMNNVCTLDVVLCVQHIILATAFNTICARAHT